MGERFEVVFTDSLEESFFKSYGEAFIIRDKKTGVLYLANRSYDTNGIGVGLTVMVDKDGKPLTQL